MKKNHLLLTAIVLALVLCFSCGIFAADITSDKDNPNQYRITEGLQNFNSTDDLWIGTLAQWKADGKAVGSTGTVFENGEAINDDDIIITNGKIGVVLAVGTRNPWGYPAGSIIDAGYCVDGKAARDTVWAIEFLAHRWDSWAPDNCGEVKFDVVKYDFAAKKEVESGQDAVKVTRIFNQVDGVPFDVVTYYGLGVVDGENVVYYFTEMTNNGDKDVKLKNDIAITNKGDDGGSMVGKTARHIAGNYGNVDGKKFSTFVAAPAVTAEEWAAGTAYDKGSVGYKELVQENTYAPGETKLNEHYVVIDNEASTEAVQNFLNAYDSSDVATVSGTVADAKGNAIASPVVVVNKGGKTFGWYFGDQDGKFSFKLPKADDYEVFTEVNGFAAGEKEALDMAACDNVQLTSGGKKVAVTFNLKDKEGNPVYGRVELFVPGEEEDTWVSAYPTVRFCGDSVYLDYVADGDAKGVIKADVAPGKYKAVVYGEGFWFYSDPVEIIGDTANAADLAKDVTIDMTYDAPEGYLSGDLHHHANKNDAFADPKDAVPSLAASGLDVAFITDHDFTVNNKKAFDLAGQYELEGFIPSEEISCSWAHFNVIPLNQESYTYFLDENAENHVMDQFGKLPDFVKQTHDKGAAITANHPWYSYGLFSNKDKAPGGYTDDYDNIEINSCSDDTEGFKLIESAITLWTSYLTGEEDDFYGKVDKPHYIVGGSDTHDVRYPGFADSNYNNTLRTSTDYVSGKIRTFAYVGETGNDITENGLAYAHAVVDGHSFTTYGPLLDADKVPGTLNNASDGVFKLTVDIQSLEGIKDVIVLSSTAKDVFESDCTVFNGLPYVKEYSKTDINEKEYTFNLNYKLDGMADWVAVIVVDANNSYAISNPYWIVDTFTDVDLDAWYAEAVLTVQNVGLIKGYEDGTFRPETAITRAEFATMMYRSMADEGEKASTEANFSDVKGHWAKDAIDYLAAEKVINGYPDGTFRPDAKISRAEIAQMIYKATGLDELNKHFTDVQPGSWYYDAVSTLGAIGVLNGYPDNSFMPNSNARRCEVAQIFANLINMEE